MHIDHAAPAIPAGLIDALRALPAEREIEHCGARFRVAALDMYAACPECGARIKLRGFSGHDDVEDVVDAVLEWMLDPECRKVAEGRQAVIERDRED